jgi:hypothetical protein
MAQRRGAGRLWAAAAGDAERSSSTSGGTEENICIYIKKSSPALPKTSATRQPEAGATHTTTGRFGDVLTLFEQTKGPPNEDRPPNRQGRMGTRRILAMACNASAIGQQPQ